jgi:hypothetical protein
VSIYSSQLGCIYNLSQPSFNMPSPAINTVLATAAAIAAISLALCFSKPLPFEVLTDVYHPVIPNKSQVPVEKVFPEILQKPLQVEDLVSVYS